MIPDSGDLATTTQRSTGTTGRPKSATVPPTHEAHHTHSSTHVQPRKVAKVKPNPRNVEHSVPNPGSEGQEQSVDGGSASLQPSVTERTTAPPSRTSTNPVSPFSESATNTECNQLIRQLWNLRDELVEFHLKASTVLTLARKQLRLVQKQNEVKRSQVISSSKLLPQSPVGLTPLDPSLSDKVESSLAFLIGLDQTPNQEFPASLNFFILGLQNLMDAFVRNDEQFHGLPAAAVQCRPVLYTKVLHARKYVVHDYFSILHCIHQLIATIVHLLATSMAITGPILNDNFLAVCHFTEVYNISLEAALWRPRDEVKGHVEQGQQGSLTSNKDKGKIQILQRLFGAMQNDAPWLRMSLKPLSATKLLTFYLQKRIQPVSTAFIEALQLSFQKQGVTSDQPITTEFRSDLLEICLQAEETRLLQFLAGLLETPSLLGKPAVQNKSIKRLRRTLVHYFYDRLLACVGEAAKEMLLWGRPNPLALESTSSGTQQKYMLGLAIAAQITAGSKVSEFLPVMASVSKALRSFTLFFTWDQQIQGAFEIATKLKRPEQTQLLPSIDPAQWATTIGQHFAHILTTVLLLMDGQSPSNPDQAQSEVIAPHSNQFNLSDEELLAEEAQMLFRFDATFFYFVAWVTKRSKSWLNSWALPQFLAASQRDTHHLWLLINSRQTILITRDILLNSKSTSVCLAAKQRQLCADDLRSTVDLLHGLPKEALEDVGPICLTLSLATLRSCMPQPKHWEGVGPGCGLDPDNPSPYVQTFIGRVIEPAIEASVQYVSATVQEAIGKEVVHAASDAWLQYILQRKIRFSEWGAVQLLRDFTALREWIRDQNSLAPEARKAILELEILKCCEGVGFLLLRSPGDILGVGKAVERRRRHSPSPGTSSQEASPSLSASVTQDDIPPEMYVSNQQMWLQLRLRPRTLPFYCC